MNRYIALLRGINISGKNKIAMSELKEGFIKLHFTDVSTYLNSGNVIFSSDIDDKNILSDNIKSMIKDRFDLDIPIFIILQEELKEILNNAPDWWSRTTSSNISDNITIRTANREVDIKSFISYVVGCILGRYSINVEGIIYAGG